MKTYETGRKGADLLLIQPVDEHDLAMIEEEARLIRSFAGDDFHLIACKVDSWNRDLSPWKAPAVFGKDNFGGGAPDTLAEILSLTAQDNRPRIIGGYSLAGLFALWAACECDAFAGVAAASPSVWFPGWVAYMAEHSLQSRLAFLSLGDREEKTRNPVMATVGDCIRACHRHLQEAGITCTLEWNPGNHFQNPELRCARAFAWVMQQLRKNDGGDV